MTGPFDPDIETNELRQALARATADIAAQQAQHAVTVRTLHTQIQQLGRAVEGFQTRLEHLLAERQALLGQIAALQRVDHDLDALYDIAEAMAEGSDTATAQIAGLKAARG
jgi:chromosome segregation ATPase